MSEERNNIERTIKTEEIYDGRIVHLRVETVELPNMVYAKREIVSHQRGVGMIVLKDENTMLMVRQYRIAVRESLLEIPAGLVEPGESPRDAAQRELQEEVGVRANQLEYLMDAYASPGFTDEKLSLFLAQDLETSKLPLDSTEFLTFEEHNVEELYRMVLNFEIVDAKTIIAILYAHQLRTAGQK
ncbi:NUDIX hydrolase [Murdochiella vaginalis]|uniref:NUDIX hydrolase n=1 Tax=Murdochiella vaginalis TaxID=1852373 RepID=UPI0008FDABD1|nr:NUDIX hydrolase [Murdochiella vaginalis]